MTCRIASSVSLWVGGVDGDGNTEFCCWEILDFACISFLRLKFYTSKNFSFELSKYHLLLLYFLDKLQQTHERIDVWQIDYYAVRPHGGLWLLVVQVPHCAGQYRAATNKLYLASTFLRVSR